MSYLDLPRLIFAGRFFANPATINNKLANFHPDVKLLPWSGASSATVLEEFAGFQYINPNGLSNFCLSGCLVTGLHSMDGRRHQVLSALGTVVSGAPYARIVDLDADQQSISQIYGLVIRVDLADGSGFEGPLEPTCLQDLWYGRVPSASLDQKAAGWFQSLIPSENITWRVCPTGRSIVQPLKDRCVTGISIKLMLDAYQGDSRSPDFNYGRVIGIAGPGLEHEPVGFPAVRRLNPCGPTFGPGFWKLDHEAQRITIDLSNSASLQQPAGESIDQGAVRAVLGGESGLEPLGADPLDYSRDALVSHGGIVDIAIGRRQAAELDERPLAISAELPNAPLQLLLKEDASLKWINCEPSWLRLEAGGSETVTFYARKAGKPLQGEVINLGITRHHINNRPRSGVDFPRLLTSDERGQARAVIRAHSPRPLPPRRGVVDSQVYYIGGSWQCWGDLTRQSGGGALSVLVFGETPPVENPTWIDHTEPVFSFYARLYPGIAWLLGLDSYQSICANGAFLRWCLSLPWEHPLHFPHSRDLAPTKAQMLCRWFDNGMPYD